MKPLDNQITGWALHLTGYLLFGAVWLRSLVVYADNTSLAFVLALLLAYLVLLASEDRMAAWREWYPVVYLSLQTVLILSLLLAPGREDFFWLLFLALCLQAMRRFPPRVAYAWTGLFVALGVASLAPARGLAQGLMLMGVYGALAVFLSAYALATVRAESARAANQEVLGELREANRQIEAYAAQAQRLAVARERSRMARDLHDSVTQTIFSMVLTTQSALLLFERDPARAGPQVDRLQELGRSALAEMRSLAANLRPVPVGGQGLVAMLGQHLADRRLQDDLSVTLQVEGAGDLSPAEEQGLFRIVQEALNNVSKHADTKEATVTLHLEAPFSIEIRDQGRGFDPAGQKAGAGMGLSGMRERAGEIGWSLVVDSVPGSGTRVRLARQVAREA